MKTMEIKNDRNYAVDLLKLFLCFGVVLYHINYTFYYGIDDKSVFVPGFAYLFGIPFRGLFNGTFNVYLFCVLSGYFASTKIIKSFKELIVVCLKRYYVFLVPTFFCNLICFVLYKNNLFYHKELSHLFNNTWLLNNYPEGISFLTIVKQSLYFGSILNQPLWMLSSLFCGNILIYFSSYLKSKSKRIIWNYGILVLLLIGYYLFKSVFCFQFIIISVTYAGFIICELQGYLINVKPRLAKIIFIIFFIFFGNLKINNNTIQCTVYFFASVLLIYLFLMGFLKKNYSKIENFFTSISFDIYIIHWPCFLSICIGAGLSKIYSHIPYALLYIVAVIWELVFTVVFAFLLNICSSKTIQFVKFISQKINK